LQLFFHPSFPEVKSLPRPESFPFNHIPQRQALPPAAVVHRGWSKVVERFVVALIVVVFHEAFDFQLQFTRQVVVLQVDHVLDRPVISLDLALPHNTRSNRVNTSSFRFSLPHCYVILTCPQ